ncbi:hypothetical protein ACFWNK_34135 [Streptomyces sp. NPDC058417]|uniref:hypothetical protein n=1 Tax=unclassified Streptomyces TaxID=2593676 RepID=UPI00365B037C
MDDHRLEGPGENGTPVPRDLPDQLAGAGDDPWEAPSAPAEAAADDTAPDDPESADEPPDVDDTPDPDAPDLDTPDTDEAGTGRRGAPHAATVNPDHPTPDESPA